MPTHRHKTWAGFLIALDVLFLASAETLQVGNSRKWPWLRLLGVGCLGAGAAVAWIMLR